MNDDELKLLKKLFFELDVKGVGVITKEELFKGMEECFGSKITREEAEEIFSNIDYDNNGTISFDEFVKDQNEESILLHDTIDKINLELDILFCFINSYIESVK